MFELEKLQNKLSKTWNSELELYKLFYRKNPDGSSELYIPLGTEYTDDVIVQKIYNKDDEFVAKNIEENIDFPLYDLESEELFFESITDNRQTVYRLRDKKFEEYLSQSKKEKIQWIFETGITTIMFYGLLAFVWQTYGFHLALIIFTVATFMQGLSVIIPAIFLIESIKYIRSYVKYKKSSHQVGFKSFTTEPK